MRCRECGLELDARDRLPNGAYQCPECGAIHHTASSSRLSPSPWRRRRRTGLGAAADALTERRFGLPLWGWIAIALVVILALILLFVPGGKGDADVSADASAAPSAQATQGVPLDQPLDGANGMDGAGSADGALSASAEPTQIPSSGSTLSTGVALNDFTVGFDWAMSKLKYSDALTLLSSGANPAGETVNSYSFQDWFTLQLVLAPNSETIRSATATVQLEAGATDNTRALGGLAATVYSLDNSISANAARQQLEAMIADNSKFYDRAGFTGKLASNDSEYVLTLSGKL